jgi:putative salt-induced outer membrane protein YdiY
MEDVVRTHSVVVNTFVLTEQRVVVGVGEFFPNSVEIKTKSGNYSYPREELLSLVMGNRNERKLWSGKANAGISSSSGNTNQMTANIQASIRRRGAFLRLDSSYYGNFGQARGVTNVRNQQLSLQVDLFIRDRFFLIPVVFEYYTDEFSNIDLRIRPGSGMGYQIAQRSDLEWDITALAQYQRLDFVSVLPGQNSNSESFAVSVANHTSWDITDDLSLDTDYTLTLPTSSPSNPDQQAIITLAVDITKYLSLTSTLNWTRVGDPQEQADGTTPEQDDISISFGLGITF